MNAILKKIVTAAKVELLGIRPKREDVQFAYCYTCTKADAIWRSTVHPFVQDRMVTGPQMENCFLHNHNLDPVNFDQVKRESEHRAIDEAFEREAFERGEMVY